MRPWGKRVLVRRIAAKETTKGGIIIPDGSKEKQSEGEVIDAGVDDDVAFNLAEGDIVIFGKYSGVEVDDLLILNADDILAVR